LAGNELAGNRAARPWTHLYRPDLDPDPALENISVLHAFRRAVGAFPDLAIVRYFDGLLTVRDLEELSDALAVALIDRGIRPTDRIGLYMQNVPQFVVALLAAWKAGAIAVPVNPMCRERELSYQLDDSGAKALICLRSLYESVAKNVVGTSPVQYVITTSGLDFQSRDDSRIFADAEPERPEGTDDLAELLGHFRGSRPATHEPAGADVALLTYTSGTTGKPKAAMNTHQNLASNAEATRNWMELTRSDRILGIAPLFHVTGLVCHAAVSLLTPVALVLTFRFDPEVMLDAMREHQPTFTIGAITAFIALMNAPTFARDDFSSFTKIYSGGAPVSPATAEQFARATGHRVYNAYGLTESTAPTHFCPFGVPTPVDPVSGALSIGVPTPGTQVDVLDMDGNAVAPGDIGEFAISGRQVVPGYWRQPEATAAALPDARLRTGDVGFMDPAGWFYIVDRKKDMIVASGYKVWPREVEDVLYEHPAVREAAVVGVPDAYRGETVKAFVSLKPGTRAEPGDLIGFARERLAAYKYPRDIEILAELPKTTSGKILRRQLREL
jgi:long-chain acyl-CoA synthetase